MPGDATAHTARLRAENVELRARLTEAEDMLAAIRMGEVDALVVESGDGPRVFTLQGVDAASSRARGEMLAHVSDAVIAIDDDQRVTYFNAAAEQQYGLDASSVLGAHLSKVYTSRWSTADDEAAAALALRSGGSWRGESVHIRRDGRELPVESSVTVLRDGSGHASGVLSIVRDISNRRKTESALRYSEHLHRVAFTQAPVGMAYVHPDACFAQVNEALSVITGYDADELIGMPVAELIHPDDREHDARLMLPLLTGHAPVYHNEKRLIRKDGSVRWVAATARMIRDEKGRPLHTIDVIRDISDRKLVQERLSESEKRFRSTFENAAIGIAHVATNGTWLRVNERLCEITGYRPDELRRKTFQQITHPDDLENDLEHLRRMVDGEIASYSMEKRYFRKDGATVWVNLTVSAMRDDDGAIEYFISMIEDIEARKASERQRQEALRLVDNILNTAPVSIYVVDQLTQKAELVNARARELLDFDDTTWTDIIPRIFDLMHPDDRRRMAEHLVRLEENTSNEPIEFEYRTKHRDGGWRWFLSRDLVYERTVDGSVAKILRTATDITERKRVEEHTMLLMGEINHRAKNLLAVVQSVARQTARGAHPETFVARLSDRIQGLSASQDLLVRNMWQGVEIVDLVRAQLAHFKDLLGTRISLEGPPARLTPPAAQGIGMALHELSTNAAKYGALAVPGGRITVSWKLADDPVPTLTMRWLEEGGPHVSPPTHIGFGQIVIGAMAEAAVHGKVDLDYRKSGLLWTLIAPAADVLERERRAVFKFHANA